MSRGVDDRSPASYTDAEIDALVALVSRAAAAILAFNPTSAAARLKPDHSPVTAADEAAQAVLVEGLARLFPGLPIVAEETPEGDRPSGPLKRYALVDPLDGTREFLAGRDEFTVNLAIVVGGAPALGLVAAPALGLVWQGIVGKGAKRLRLAPGAPPSEARETTTIRTRRRPETGLVATVSRSHFDAKTAAFLDALLVGEYVACGSSVKFCRIAEGAADIYPRLAPTSEWDIAAGHAVLVAAGGIVTTPDGVPLVYGHAEDRFRVPGFLAWGDPEAARALRG